MIKPWAAFRDGPVKLTYQLGNDVEVGRSVSQRDPVSNGHSNQSCSEGFKNCTHATSLCPETLTSAQEKLPAKK